MDNAKLEIIANSTGPTPWYWDKFPAIIGASGTRFVWGLYGKSGRKAYTPAIGPETQPDILRVALNTYTRAFKITPSQLGLWFPVGADIKIMGFEPEQLQDFTFLELPAEFDAGPPVRKPLP